MEYRSETRPVSWIIENYRSDFLFIDETFQRRYIWRKKDKIALIETILIQYSIPEIYLWESDLNRQSGKTKYSVIDGQQRIKSIIDYSEGIYKLESSLLDYSDSKYSDKYFDQLDEEDKKSFWTYLFTIVFVSEKSVKDEITHMFLRINRTSMTLNPQELRHATHEGKFIKLSYELSELEFWEKYKIFTGSEFARMRDVQFMSSILIFLRFGIEGELSQININKAYDLFNETYKEYKNDKNTVKKLLDIIEQLINNNDLNIKFIRRKVHIYTLLVLAYDFLIKKIRVDEKIKEKFSNFVKTYYDKKDIKKYFSEKEMILIDAYRELAQEGTQSRVNRLTRFEILEKLFLK